MASGANLLGLQGQVKGDPDGYKEEFLLQYRHYQALLEIFRLKPSKESKEFGDLVMFLAQVSKAYPTTTASFAGEVMALLDSHGATLDPALRRTLVQALILMRNRGQVEAVTVLPLFFRLFRCQDKALRQQLFRHIVSDIKAANKKGRNERLNRAVQNFMYGVVVDDNEPAAKRSLAVLTELWRRQIWRDARTVNVIASAAFHPSSRVMLAVMKFFLGQDRDSEDGEDSDGEGGGGKDEEKPQVAGPSKEEIYKATKKGTKSSKKKKVAKLKRVMNTVRKQSRKTGDQQSESFAAIHLLNDPQTFAEKLFSRLQSCNERFETRMAVMSVISRVVGMHKLQLLNFYPFLQKYIAPHQRDVTVVLAATVQAAHDLVPPDILAPVLKQLVDQFVNDKARPEVMTIGLKAVRELCLRCPLVMTEELLQDLALYKKFRDKQVSSAARGLIGIFRDINPELLAKKDRGRGADMALKPRAFGDNNVRSRIEGAELLEAAEAAGQGSDEDNYQLPEGGGSDSSDEDGDLEDMSDDDEGGEGEDEDGEAWQDVSDEDERASGDEGDEGEESSSEYETDDGEEAGPSGSGDDEGEKGEDAPPAKQPKAPKKQIQPQTESLSALKKRLADAKSKKRKADGEPDTEDADKSRQPSAAPGVPIEMDRIFSQEDFDRMKRLRQKQLVEAAMAKHGLKAASTAKRARMVEVAEEEAEEHMALADKRDKISEARVNPDDLRGSHKWRKNKEERMASVLAGREDRTKFGAASGRKKAKTGGLSERQKQKKKAMPIAARISQLRRKAAVTKQKKRFTKNFKGHAPRS